MTPPFAAFDPLQVKGRLENSLAAQRAVRREINNILSSYVGWYDPFCELIQNGLDALEARGRVEVAAGTISDFEQHLRVIVDLDRNELTVSDNGCGMTYDEFKRFLAPNFSFKEEVNSRGHKGVGATYLAYGFNYLRVHTKSPGYEACGRILNGRTWLAGSADGDPPLVEPDSSADIDEDFEKVERGTTVTVRFDEYTHPKKLSWLAAKDADTWLTILRVKTGVGSVEPSMDKTIEVTCIAGGESTTATISEVSYLWLHNDKCKSARISEVASKAQEQFKKYGTAKPPPNAHRKLDFLYEEYHWDSCKELLTPEAFAEHEEVVVKHRPTIKVEYGYTTKLWKRFNEKLGIRSNMQVLRAGIQLAANLMPQGDVLQVPLTRYTGRQNQVHFLIHFENYTPDLGRKGFAKPLVDFATDVASAIVQGPITRLRPNMKRDSGTVPDLDRELRLDAWKEQMIAHEASSPLTLSSDHFFAPTKRISITSTPTREQDVIALFHEIISGGVVRGLAIMSTNERFTYDGLFRINFDHDRELFEFDQSSNPLGIDSEVLDGLLGRLTKPKVLEYKYSLDGLINDLDAQEKNLKDIDLCVAWEMGSQWREKFAVTSLLLPENTSQRSYHGLTHVLQDPDSGARHCDLIILKDLVALLVDESTCHDEQRLAYE
ncbi:hypothetical protein [Micromonospora sp. NPDC049274]|uniref:hypothetical protein n=1 Tax=Micromonospora sp. NPDC049274 TaxID=3154829 RepID=UPI0034256066